jgi:hypothetical protein
MSIEKKFSSDPYFVTHTSYPFGWLLSIAWLHKPGRRKPGSRDATNLLAPAEPGPRCFEYRASLVPHLHADNQTHTSHA